MTNLSENGSLTQITFPILTLASLLSFTNFPFPFLFLRKCQLLLYFLTPSVQFWGTLAFQAAYFQNLTSLSYQLIDSNMKTFYCQ